jgi:hypothetical protein
MNVTSEDPALRRLPSTPFTELLAPAGWEMIQNNTKMTTRKPTIFLRFTANHHPSTYEPLRARVKSCCTAPRANLCIRQAGILQ